jgi:hypothetical protein
MLSQFHVTQLNGWITRSWTCQAENSTYYSCSLTILPKRNVTSSIYYMHIEKSNFQWNPLYLLPVFHKFHITSTIYWLKQNIIINAQSIHRHAHVTEQDRQCTRQHNIQAHLHKQCCHGKAISITHSEFVSADLSYPACAVHAAYYTASCSMSCFTIFYTNFLIKTFREMVLNVTSALYISPQLVSEISHFNKTPAI